MYSFIEISSELLISYKYITHTKITQGSKGRSRRLERYSLNSAKINLIRNKFSKEFVYNKKNITNFDRNLQEDYSHHNNSPKIRTKPIHILEGLLA